MQYDDIVNSAKINANGLQNGLTSMASGNLSLGELSAASINVGLFSAQLEIDKGVATFLFNQWRKVGKDLMSMA